MTNAHYCPLCQPDTASGDKKSTIVKSCDGSISVECSDCGDYRVASMGDVQSMQDNPLSESRFDQMRRMINVENNFGMVPTFNVGLLL